MDRRVSLTFDAAEPRTLGQFWIVALGYVEEAPPPPHTSWPEALEAWGVPPEQREDFYAIVDPDGIGPRVFFQRVPEPKTAKNRLHLDVAVPGWDGTGERPGHDAVLAHAERLREAGATRVRVVDEPVEGYWVVMEDPEGNVFCVI
ncbi:VOC family protein [Actinotalea sp.]|uniref:VOC family protein n=1 Tax=Actinotalea sp. TaxID=1872145 RepID=UPI00356AC2B9